MDKSNLFILVEGILIIVLAVIVFRNFKVFFSCLYSFIFSGYYVFWKERWNLHYSRAMKFTGYVLAVVVLSAINAWIFRHLVKMN